MPPTLDPRSPEGDDVLQRLFALSLELQRLQRHVDEPMATAILAHAQADVTDAITVMRGPGRAPTRQP